MAGTMISENWSGLLEPNLRRVFAGAFGYTQRKSFRSVIYNVQQSNKAVEHDLTTDSFEDFEPLNANGQIPYTDSKQAYQTDYTHVEYVKGIRVRRHLLKFDLYNVIEQKVRELAVSAERTREKTSANWFNNGFSSSTGGDAVTLFSSAHPGANGGANQSNTDTLSLDATNLELVRRRMIKFNDGAGNLIEVNPDMLIVPLDLEQTAYELIASRGVVDKANNNANFLYGRYKCIVWARFLTNSTRWFVVDSELMKKWLLWFDAEPVEFARDRDFNTYISSYSGHYTCSNGHSDWRFAYGCNPS